jgi:3-oxoacyl-[acyl-carrier protein] reductase
LARVETAKVSCTQQIIMKTNESLAGKSALVTGASRGIGASIAKRLAAEGAAVAITYSRSPGKAEEVVSEIEAAGGKAIALQADAGDADAVRAAVRKTVEVFGGIDILVNNAGVAEMAPIEEYTLENFDRLVAVNIRGLFVASQEAARHMKEGGRIIHIGSTNAERIAYLGGSVYGMTKGAVASFTKGLARDLGARGITVNNVQPGPVDTEMNPADGPFAEVTKSLLAIPRYGKGEEVAGFVAYLARPEAGFITGANLLIDGGYAA